jgi:asparagine synthase (glutamine-hydrolysing)
MFAIALWDADSERLVLVRDRLGVKPLYWCRSGASLAYASEPQALLAGGWVPRRPDRRALLEYMTLQYVPPPRSGFEGIRKIAPGAMLIWEGGREREEVYWRLPVPPDPLTADPEQALGELDELLRDATRQRLRSDVPLGAFLSGGVDSSVVVSYMAELVGQVRTFSIDFPQAGFSEAAHARRVAGIYGTEHEELTLTAEMVPAIAEAIPRMGEPFADSSAIPTYLLSELTRRRVTVALSGDGGDEAFGGYHRYLRAVTLARVAPVAGLVGSVLECSVPRRALGAGRAGKAIHLAASSRSAYQRMMSHFEPDELRAAATAEFLADAGPPEAVWTDHLQLPVVRGIRRYSVLDTVTYLPGDLLPKVDRMSMAHALEVRSPLLDYRVHEFAANLPNRLRWHRAEGKVLLKRLAASRGLPTDLVHRRKQGFGIPIGHWFRDGLRGWISDLLAPDTIRARGLIRPEAASTLLADHQAGLSDNTVRLWNLAALELWFRAHID